MAVYIITRILSLQCGQSNAPCSAVEVMMARAQMDGMSLFKHREVLEDLFLSVRTSSPEERHGADYDGIGLH